MDFVRGEPPLGPGDVSLLLDETIDDIIWYDVVNTWIFISTCHEERKARFLSLREVMAVRVVHYASKL